MALRCPLPSCPYATYIKEFSVDQKGKESSTPWKISMEPKNEGLEDDFPFQLDDF